MKQTAIEWLTDIFYANEGIMKSEWLEHAKELEKIYMEKIYGKLLVDENNKVLEFEEYYKKTFKSE